MRCCLKSISVSKFVLKILTYILFQVFYVLAGVVDYSSLYDKILMTHHLEKFMLQKTFKLELYNLLTIDSSPSFYLC